MQEIYKDDTQNEKVLKHLQNYKKLTSWEAFERYGITRLSGRIYDLRVYGWNIKSNPRTVKNRYGKAVTITEYSLGKPSKS